MNPYFAQVVRIAEPTALRCVRRLLRAVAPLVALAVVAPVAVAQPQESQLHRFTITTVAEGLRNPWGLAFLGDGSMLVTERPGTMRVVSKDGKVGAPLKGVPEVVVGGQGGLLDVVADSNYASNKTVYFCYSEPDLANRSSGANSTAVARATLG
jgi:aldose sugar dehydrogenase